MPVIVHEAVPQEAEAKAPQRFGQDRRKGREVPVFAEDIAVGIAAIDDVEDDAGGRDACGAWHVRSVASGAGRTQINVLIPFSYPYPSYPLFLLARQWRVLRLDEYIERSRTGASDSAQCGGMNPGNGE